MRTNRQGSTEAVLVQEPRLRASREEPGYGLLGSGLDDVGRERNSERFGDVLIEHQLLDRDFLERDVARLLAAQDAREDLRRGFAGRVPSTK